MSRKDTYHEIVKEILQQERWIITYDPYSNPKSYVTFSS